MSESDLEIMRKLGSVGHAFFGRFHSLRDVQRKSIPPILNGQNVLVISATASGKTEAVFAPLVNRIRSIPKSQKQSTRILAVAPTRALVNDLYARLERPLSEIGWSCGRQTGDHSEKHRKPEVLITTPESFDSMLVRDGVWENGELVSHLLIGIESVFIDEAHLFDASPRGDQVSWLLGRVRRLKKHAHKKGWVSGDVIQTCGASATISNPDKLAEKLLGSDSTIVQVGGSREMALFCADVPSRWIGLEDFKSLDQIFSHIPIIDGQDDLDAIINCIWASIEKGVLDDNRKVLVFVPTRALCDKLSLSLSDALRRKRDIFVGAHHGSLDRKLRENAEQKFMSTRDTVLVATTTLEVGIDIGDVDVVVLVGCPQGTTSLLQRVGRSGRRKGCSMVLPIARNRLEARALASMLDTAFKGKLESNPDTRLWSVLVQQAASYTAQAGKRGRRREDLLNLSQDVWPESSGSMTAVHILDSLLEQEFLEEKGGRLILGGPWSDRLEGGGGGLHHNFESGSGGVPVIDSSTGEVLTYVAKVPDASKGIALAGRRWDIVSEGGEVHLKSSVKQSGTHTFRYLARSAPTSKSFADHVRRGLGFEEAEAPVVCLGTEVFWFYFGGSAYEAILISCFSQLKRARGFSGLALSGSISEENIQNLLLDKRSLFSLIRESAESLSSAFSFGRFHAYLPEEIRKKTALSMLEPNKFIDWLSSRKISLLEVDDEKYRKLIGDLT